jgi:hypothetical protein
MFLLDPICSEFGANDVETRASAEVQMKRVRFRLNAFNDRLAYVLRDAFFRKAPMERLRKRNQYVVFAAESGVAAIAHLKEILSVQAIEGEGLAEEQHFGK